MVQEALLTRWLNDEDSLTQRELETILGRTTHKLGRRAVQRNLQLSFNKGLVERSSDGTLHPTGTGVIQFCHRVAMLSGFAMLEGVKQSMAKYLFEGVIMNDDELIFQPESGEFLIKEPHRASRRLIDLSTLAARIANLLESKQDRAKADWDTLLGVNSRP
jgi:hypothetical protein